MHRLLLFVFAFTFFYETTGVLKACARCLPKGPRIVMTGQYVRNFSTNVVFKDARGCERKTLVCRSNDPVLPASISLNNGNSGSLQNASYVRIQLVCSNQAKWTYTANHATAVINSLTCQGNYTGIG